MHTAVICLLVNVINCFGAFPTQLCTVTWCVRCYLLSYVTAGESCIISSATAYSSLPCKPFVSAYPLDVPYCCEEAWAFVENPLATMVRCQQAFRCGALRAVVLCTL
jgi:hypothetical protein